MAFGCGRLAGCQSFAFRLRGGRGALGQLGVSHWPASFGVGPGAWSLVLPPSVPDGLSADLGRQTKLPSSRIDAPLSGVGYRLVLVMLGSALAGFPLLLNLDPLVQFNGFSVYGEVRLGDGWMDCRP